MINIDTMKKDEVERMSAIIGNYTGINKVALSILISNFGIEAVLNNPFSLGLDSDKADRLNEISIILHSIGADYDESV